MYEVNFSAGSAQLWMSTLHLWQCLKGNFFSSPGVIKGFMHAAGVKVHNNGHLVSQVLWVRSSKVGLGSREHLQIQASV